ncbi:MAG: septum formation initiator family protein [Lentimicrobiaceae bacterium]|nr:septum formation initiator family protein [Lentimicrobiaceae bacterium]
MRFIEICSKYKYIIAVVIFAVCFFFGENSILETRQLDKRINDLKTELREYKQSASSVKTQNSTLTNSTMEETEEYLRKHHNLKKENEDVFRIVQQKK